MEIALIIGAVVSWLYVKADKQKESLRVKGAWLILTTLIFIGLNIIKEIIPCVVWGYELPLIAAIVVRMALVSLPFIFIIIIVRKNLEKIIR